MISYEPPNDTGDNDHDQDRDPDQLAKLQEKVRALERQNAALRQSTPHNEVEEKERDHLKKVEQENNAIMEGSLIDINGLNGSEGDWLCGEPGLVGPGDEVDWLRSDLEESPVIAIKKKSLVNKLDDLARRSPGLGGGGYSSRNLGGPSSTSSPLHSYLAASSTPNSRFGTPSARPGGHFDSSTFRRGSAGPRNASAAYSIPDLDGSMTPQRKTSYHRLAFGARTGSQGPPTPNDDDDDDEVGLDQLEISEVEPKMNKVNSTFEKKSGTSRTNLTYDNCDDQSNLLNGTFDKVPSPPLNSTFNRGTALNSTFSKPAGTINTTFEKVNSTFEKVDRHDQRKMSEDRLSSSSSTSNRLSRESSQDLLVEDLDRLSTTSAMSESSASHRLNDVQDVQDLARLQEENLKHSTGPKHQRSDTISPLSEQSLSSPVEDTGGYQSEESCGSENGLLGSRPRRGDVQYQGNGGGGGGGYQQYSSQDSLPDSPYSSQSLDSHAGQTTDTRRSMPNLNKMRGGRVGSHQPPSSNPAYGLSQARYTSSDSRLMPPTRSTLGPSGQHGQAPTARTGLRPPQTTSGLVRPSYTSGLRPPAPARGLPRKVSGIARPPGGIPRPGQSRLQAPASYNRRGGSSARPSTGGQGGGVGGKTSSNGHWAEDCY